MSSQPQLTDSSHFVNISMQTSLHSSQYGFVKIATDEFLALDPNNAESAHIRGRV